MKKFAFILLLVLSSQAGCTLTDPEVMEMLQALQAQNDKLLQEITSMKGQLTALDGKYQAILAGLADNKKDLEALKGQVEALKTQIADQLKKIDELTTQLTQQGADVVKLSAELAAVKASLADLLAQFEELVNNQENRIFYQQNGTIKCPAAKVGDKGFVDGKQYEAVDRALLIKRRDEGADLTCVCTSLVTDMKELFSNASFNQPIGNWDVSNVTTMEWMFQNTPFDQDLGFWDVRKVTTMAYMFSKSKFNKPITNWNVGNVTSLRGMFQEASSFNQPLGNWNVSKVTDMRHLFDRSAFNQPIANWDVSNVRDLAWMFNRTPFNQPIGNWNVAKVTDMQLMFLDSPFNQPIGNWNVGQVQNMHRMFLNSQFNQSIANWNVKNVKDMTFMFEGSKFNQNISAWCVSQFTTEPNSFSNNGQLQVANKPKWGTCPSSGDANGNLADKYPAGSVFGSAGPTIIVDVTNPKTGKTWMDRNLGASRAATSSTDAASYGDLYQWGRGADGHQLRTSATTTVLSSSNQSGNGNFIVAPNEPYDWRSPQNTNLWQGVAGVNNPCPSGYRLPTETELNEEHLSWNTDTSAGAFASPLKWTVAGYRNIIVGSLLDVGTHGNYWSSTVISTSTRDLSFSSRDDAGMYTGNRALGASVRCIKN